MYWSSEDESEDMEETTSDDEEEDMENESSDEDNINKSYIYEDESRWTQIMPPDNNKIYEFWSSDENEDIGDTTTDEEDEDMENTSSDDEGGDDMNKFYIHENEPRPTQIMAPNINKINEAWSSNGESKDMGDTTPDDEDEEVHPPIMKREIWEIHHPITEVKIIRWKLPFSKMNRN